MASLYSQDNEWLRLLFLGLISRHQPPKTRAGGAVALEASQETATHNWATVFSNVGNAARIARGNARQGGGYRI